MSLLISFLSRFRVLFLSGLLVLACFLPFGEVSAKTPPEIRNQDELKLSQDMHGKDLNGYEFVKLDLKC